MKRNRDPLDAALSVLLVVVIGAFVFWALNELLPAWGALAWRL